MSGPAADRPRPRPAPPSDAPAPPSAGSRERPRPRPKPAPTTEAPTPTTEAPTPTTDAPTPTTDAAGAAADAAAAAPIGLAALRPPPPPHPPSGARSDADPETLGRNNQPDISRFLQATEPQADHVDRKADRKAEKKTEKKAAKKGEGGKDGEKSVAKGRARLWRSLFRLLVLVAIAATAAILLRVFVVQPYFIPSPSMEPTLHGCPGCNNDHILVEKVSHDISSGDIVVFNRPPGDNSPEKVLIKRVIGIADDTVSLRHGDVYVNGLRIDEPYVNKKCNGHLNKHPTSPPPNRSSWHVSSGQLFVMGDNRCDSHDSRAFGPIKTSSVIGKAFLTFWPLGRFGFF